MTFLCLCEFGQVTCPPATTLKHAATWQLFFGGGALLVLGGSLPVSKKGTGIA